MRRPDFFLVGAPKCGTSSLFGALRSHPDVFMPALKEPHFFGGDHHRLNHEPRSMDAYLGLFADAGDRTRVGEASTSYLHSARAPDEIKRFDPNAQIIIMVRNPVDIMYALHNENVVGGFEPITDFREALQAEPRRKIGRDLPARAGILETLFYREVATLEPQVRRYFAVFGREQVHVIVFEDWVADAATAVAATLDFLGLRHDVPIALARANPSRQLRNQLLQRVVREPPALLARLASVVPRSARDQIRYAVQRGNTRVAARPALDPALRDRLLVEVAPDVAALGALLGRDLPAWST